MTPSPDALVLRSNVGSVSAYGEYRPSIRYDFFYSCAYCFMSETEAHGISFELDHYLPKSARPDIENSYDNIMYCCKVCNTFKGDRPSPDSEEAIGYRFYRADYDFFGDHYQPDGVRLTHTTLVGEYTIEFLNLNRKSLRKLRELRKKVAKCDIQHAIGMLWLRNFHIDQLPQSLRLKGQAMIKEVVEQGQDAIRDTSELVRRLNRSDLIDPEDDTEMRERKRRLKLLKERMLG